MKESWSLERDELLLVRLMVYRIEEGNRPLGIFKSMAWAYIKAEFRKETGLLLLKTDQFKSRLDNLRKTWQAGEEMCKQSGGVFDPVTMDYIGDLDWLDDFCRKTPAATYFKTKPYTMREGLTKICGAEGTTARGQRAVGLAEVEGITLKREDAPEPKRRKVNATLQMALSVEAVAAAIRDEVERESQWMEKATKAFGVKYVRRLSIETAKVVMRRFREDPHVAQQFCIADSTVMKSLVLGVDLDDVEVEERVDEAVEDPKLTMILRLKVKGGCGKGDGFCVSQQASIPFVPVFPISLPPLQKSAPEKKIYIL